MGMHSFVFIIEETIELCPKVRIGFADIFSLPPYTRAPLVVGVASTFATTAL
jgi:hypothetical protein